jgi:hypothetical protein
MSSVPVPVSARLYHLPDDVLRALATFLLLSDLLVLVRCSRHFRVVLQRQLNRRLDRLFVVTYDEEDCVTAGPRRRTLLRIPDQPEQRVVDALFGEGEMRDDVRAYCFTDGQSILSLTQRKFMDISGEYAPYYFIEGEDTPVRYRFASWLCYRCDQQLATEAYA